VSPLRTECGLYNVMVALEGTQAVTRMRIVRTNENGGFFVAPLSLSAKLTFTPVAGRGRETRELVQVVEFDSNPRVAWSDQMMERRVKRINVDTDGDLEPDTVLPLGSRFATPTKALAGCHCDSSLSFSTTTSELKSKATTCTHLHCPVLVAE
jgi:hypothetical protein